MADEASQGVAWSRVYPVFPGQSGFGMSSGFMGFHTWLSELQSGRYTIGDTSRTGYLVLVGFDDLVGSLAAEWRRRLPFWSYVAKTP